MFLEAVSYQVATREFFALNIVINQSPFFGENHVCFIS